MTKGLYAGSFDPFTIGHLEIIRQASYLFDTIYIAVTDNPDKERMIDAEKMAEVLVKMLHRTSGINPACKFYVLTNSKAFTAELAAYHDCDFLIRGLRNTSDYLYEENLAMCNSDIADVRTIYFRAGDYGHISSSYVRELYKHGRLYEVEKYLPYDFEEVFE